MGSILWTWIKSLNSRLQDLEMISSQEINFVAFHIDIDDKVLKEAQSVAKAVSNEETENLLELMFSSVKKYYPKASLYILTDKTSKVSEYGKSTIIRYDLDKRYPILSRNKAWYQFLDRKENATIFLDSDILINDCFDDLLRTEFDIAFTFRNWKKWPINLGIIYVKNNKNNKTYNFFKDWYNQFLHLKDEQKIWGGDQDLIHEKFKDFDFSVDHHFDSKFDDYQIKFLNCSEYNYSSEMNEPMLEYPSNTKVLHFKGARKKYMKKCWEQMKNSD